MAQHTPGPWRMQVSGNGGCHIFGADSTVPVAEVFYQPTGQRKAPPSKTHEANAAHVVRAVNNFPALLAACEAALDNLGARSETRQKWTTRDQHAYEALAAAIRAAKEG